MPAVEENGNVVVPMQKDKWLLVDNDKECVNQFTCKADTENVRKTIGDRCECSVNMYNQIHSRKLAEDEELHPQSCRS